MPPSDEDFRQQGRDCFAGYVRGQVNLKTAIDRLRALGDALTPNERAILAGWDEAEHRARRQLQGDHAALSEATGLPAAPYWTVPAGSVPFWLLEDGAEFFLMDRYAQPNRGIILTKTGPRQAESRWASRPTTVPLGVEVHAWCLVLPCLAAAAQAAQRRAA